MLFITMTKAKDFAINFVLNSLIFYVIGRKIRGHRTGLRLGLIGGTISVLAVWYTHAKSDATKT